MITDEETLKMKKVILEEIAKRFEHLLKNKEMNEEDADFALKFVENKIVPAYDERTFSRTIRKFCKKYPQFSSIWTKVNNMRNELINNIGQECLENLIEDKVEEWSDLVEKLDNIDEDGLKDWVNELPSKNRAIFMDKYLNLATSG